MAITDTKTSAEAPQRDGRRWVMETHTDASGEVVSVSYLAPAGFDYTAAASARVATINAEMIANEIAANVAAVVASGSLAQLRFVYSTPLQGRAALREAYRSANRVEAVMIGDFLSSLTDAQLQTAFGLTAGQVSNLRTNKLTPAATAAAAIRAAVGA